MSHAKQWLTTAALGTTLALNFTGHKTGWWSTICTNTRRFVPADVMDEALDAGCDWLKAHYRNGF